MGSEMCIRDSVYTHGGLSGYLDSVTSPYVYIPHDVVVPGVLTRGDLADLAAALAPCPLRLDGIVDGLNRSLPLDTARSIYQPAITAYRSQAATIALTDDRSNMAQWLLNAVDQ